MTATETRAYRLGEFHQFEGGKRKFLYLVPAGAIFEVDDAAAAVINRLGGGEATHEELVEALAEDGYTFDEASDLVEEMFLSRAIVAPGTPP